MAEGELVPGVRTDRRGFLTWLTRIFLGLWAVAGGGAIAVCPCHDRRFDLAGNVLSGPPQRPLPTYGVNVRAGEIFVRV